MFKSSVVFALALLSVADGKRVVRGVKKEVTQQKKRQFTLLTKEGSEPIAFHLEPGQEVSAHGVRRLLAQDKRRRRRELRGGNGGKTGKSTEESSDGPGFMLHIDDDLTLVTLTGLSGEFLGFTPEDGADASRCTGTTCTGELAATAEGYECDPDGDEFEDTCLDVVVVDNGVEFFCPEATDVMRIQTATCICVGANPPTGTCTAPTTLTFAIPGYTFPDPPMDNCAAGEQFAYSATLVCESLIAGSSTSASSKSKSKSKSRRQ